MKTFAVLASTAALVACIHAETCDYSLVKPDFHEIGTPMASCVTATGINFTTGAELSLSSTGESEICSECDDLVDLIYSFTWYDCTMEIDGVTQTVSSYYETLVGSCSNSSSGSTTTTTTTASSSSGSTAVATCDYSLVKPDFHQIGTPMASCETATGITFETGSTLSLTSTQQSDICSECSALVELIYSFTWYDCELSIDGLNQTVKTYYETLVGSCANTSSTSSTASASTDSSSASASTSSAGTAILSTAVALASCVVVALTL